jgi:hypothetical protein
MEIENIYAGYKTNVRHGRSGLDDRGANVRDQAGVRMTGQNRRKALHNLRAMVKAGD